MSKTPTIYEVASAAGVSPATVSRYLRGSAVRAGEAVGAAIDSLGFVPSRTAQNLKRGQTHSIGVVVPDVTNPFFAAVVKGIESITRQGDYNIFLCNTEESPAREEKVIADLLGRVDGIILAPATEPSLAEAARRPPVPIVFLDRELDGEPFDCVLVDNEGGGRQAAAHLLGLGHTRVGMVSGPLDTTPGRGRHEGFVAALEEAGVELDDTLVHLGDFRQESGYQATMRLLALERPPTAIFAANNLMTIGVLHALHALDVRVPDDVSVVGFDDHELADLLDPPLTVIDRPMEEQGALAMRLLLARIEGHDERPPQRIVLDTRLLVRRSTACPTERTRKESA